MKETACCFIGHRDIKDAEKLGQRVYSVVDMLVSEKGVDTFLFGSKSSFNSFCYEQVCKIKEKHTHIKRIYVRAEFPFINTNYKDYLLESYEDTYFPQSALGAGKAVYVERNREMIDKSTFCVVYCNKDSLPESRKSGTLLALEYAVKRNKIIITLT